MENEKKSKKGLIIGLIAGIVALAVIITTTLVLVLNKNNKESQNKDKVTLAINNAITNVASKDIDISTAGNIFASPLKLKGSINLNTLNIEGVDASTLSGLSLSYDIAGSISSKNLSGNLSIGKNNKSIADVQFSFDGNTFAFTVPQISSESYSIDASSIKDALEASGLDKILGGLTSDDYNNAYISSYLSLLGFDFDSMLAQYGITEDFINSVINDLLDVLAANTDSLAKCFTTTVAEENIALKCGNATKYSLSLNASGIVNFAFDIVKDYTKKASYNTLLDTVKNLANMDVSTIVDSALKSFDSEKADVIAALDKELAGLQLNLYVYMTGNDFAGISYVDDEVSIEFLNASKTNAFEDFELTIKSVSGIVSVSKIGTVFSASYSENGSEKFAAVLDIEFKENNGYFDIKINQLKISVDGNELISATMNFITEAAAENDIKLITNATDMNSITEAQATELLTGLSNFLVTLQSELGISFN